MKKQVRSLAIIIGLLMLSSVGYSQSIVGTWQLMKQSNCMDEQLDSDEETDALLEDMAAMSNRDIPLTIEFKDNNTGAENLHTMGAKKQTKHKSFLYKFDGENLYILDKKSQTITDAYTVDKLSGDSLIYSNALRPCETKVFVRLK